MRSETAKMWVDSVEAMCRALPPVEAEARVAMSSYEWLHELMLMSNLLTSPQAREGVCKGVLTAVLYMLCSEFNADMHKLDREAAVDFVDETYHDIRDRYTNFLTVQGAMPDPDDEE